MENRFIKLACLTVLMIGSGLQAMDPGYASPGAAVGQANDLVNAAGSGDIVRVKELLNDFTKHGFGGAYSDGLKRIDIGNAYGETALMHAAGGGHKEVCKLLIAHGANVNARDREGNTALIFAALNDHREICELLIAADADVNATNKFDKTALMYAVEKGHRDVSRILLAGKLNKMDWDAVLHYGVMPSLQSRLNDRLCNAAAEGHIAKVKELIAVGADVNATDRQGQTALMHAAHQHRREVCKLLIDAIVGQSLQEQKSAAITVIGLKKKARGNKDITPTIAQMLRKQQRQKYLENKENARKQIIRIIDNQLKKELLDYLNRI